MVTLIPHDSIEPANDTSPSLVLQQIVEGLAGISDIALARIWLVQPNSHCAYCRSNHHATDSDLSLHLVASDGRSRNQSKPEVWNRISGGFHQLPLNSQKIGRIASTGEPLLVRSSVARASLLNPNWVEHEAIQSFFGYPLIHDRHIEGVLAVFSRRELDDRDVSFLRQIATTVSMCLAQTSHIADQQRSLKQLEAQIRQLRSDLQADDFQGPIVSLSPASQKWDQQISLAAQHRQPVLICGGHGAGKEFTARLIHQRSKRQETPFIRIDAATIDDSVLDRFFAASGVSGTLYLDAIEQTPSQVQERLASLIADRGRALEQSQALRIVASTTVDLGIEIAEGRLSHDIFCSLSVAEIQVPALAQRPQDLRDLATHILGSICRREHRSNIAVDDSCFDFLKAHNWPGNVRQLRTAIEWCVSQQSDHQIVLDSDVLLNLIPNTESTEKVLTADEVKRRERLNIKACLEKCNWKVYGPGGAAELLGLKPTTLMYKMQALKIRKPTR